MPKIPGVPHLQAVRALEKAGFKVVREGKHVVMSDGRRILTIPRHNPVNAYTMGGIAQTLVSRSRSLGSSCEEISGPSNSEMQRDRSKLVPRRTPRYASAA